jgi:hypothetical protein
MLAGAAGVVCRDVVESRRHVQHDNKSVVSGFESGRTGSARFGVRGRLAVAMMWCGWRRAT